MSRNLSVYRKKSHLSRKYKVNIPDLLRLDNFNAFYMGLPLKMVQKYLLEQAAVVTSGYRY